MRRKALVLEVLLLALFSISACPAATLVVDLNGTGDFTDIQSAIDAAEDGDTVLVKPGEYVIDEPINFNRLHNPDDPASPPVKNITLKSEGGADVTTIRMAETPADPERASVVIFENGEGNNGTLEGFTLSGGGRIGVLWQRGGGIFCIGSSPTIKSCKISGNLASGWCLGHGESPPSPCGEGGGVSCEGGSSPTLTNCTISGNSANFGGGGVFCQGNSFPTLTNCTISGNSAIEGGGVCCEWGSSPTLTNCTISGNLGGAVYCSSSSPTFTSCIVWGNLGGSILTEGESHPIVTFSCIENQTVWLGEGNIQVDPRFYGWEGIQDIFVDAASVGPGNGSQGNPFRELGSALEYRLSLLAGSPCIGKGKDGVNMGSDEGVRDVPRMADRVVHLAPGRYGLQGITMAFGGSILGKSQEETILEGSLLGLRTGARLSRVRVTGGRSGGIVVTAGQKPAIDSCTISGNSGGAGVQCLGGLPTLTGCTISGNSGCGVYCAESSPTLEECTISGNSAMWGGGVYCYRSSAIFTNCSISGNSANGGGGGVYCSENSSPTLTNCTISENSAPYGSGVVCSGSSPTLTNCTISGNSAVLSGGGVYCWNSFPTLTNCTITGNSAGSGGGVYCYDSAKMINCTITRNSARSGGGLYCGQHSSPTLTNCTISGNRARYGGGGVYYYDSSPTLTNCIVWDNAGGAIGGDGTPIVTYSCIEAQPPLIGPGNINRDPLFCGWPTSEVWVDASHAAPGTGTQADPYSDLGSALTGYRLSLQQRSPCVGSGEGDKNMGAETAICSAAGSANRIVHLGSGTYPIRGLALTQQVSIEGAGKDATTIEGTVYGLTTNAALSGVTITKGDHGAVEIAPGEAPEIRDCRISGNRDTGVFCYASFPRLINCTISGNSQDGSDGGGVSCYSSSPILINCTISGNRANRWGGGIYCGMNSSPTLLNCTVSGNLASEGGGIHCREDSSPTLTNCIVWENTPNSVCGSHSYCFVDEAPMFVKDGVFDFDRWTTVTIEGNDMWFPDFIVDPPDYRLLPTSPCIDAGTCDGAPGFDIEGDARPAGKGCDMGAYEFGSTKAREFLRGDCNSDSGINISDPVFNLNYQFALGPTPTCLKTADVNDDGLINLADPIFQLNYLFVSGPTPPPPLTECGIDPTADTLTCDSYPPCP